MSKPTLKVLIGAAVLILMIILTNVLPNPYFHKSSSSGSRVSPAAQETAAEVTVTYSGIMRDPPIAHTYIGNASTKKFHRYTCPYLPDQENQVTFDTRDEAIDEGYSPCGHCNP